MHPTVQELTDIFNRLFPDKKIGNISADTDIRRELCLGSLEMMMLAVALNEKYIMDIKDMIAARTVGELCGRLTSKTCDGQSGD